MTFFAAQRNDAASARERRERFGLVLAGLVLAFAIQGVAEPGPWEQVLVSALLAQVARRDAMRAGDGAFRIRAVRLAGQDAG